MVLLFSLFLSFFKVGALSFGGAYSLIPVIEFEVVTTNAWLDQEEFLSVLSIAEFIPGAISIKFATYVGYKTAGILGVIAANLGNMVVPVVLTLIAYWTISSFGSNKHFSKAISAMKFAAIGMVVAIMTKYLLKGGFNFKLGLFFLVGLSLVFLKIHPAVVILIAGALGVFLL